MATIERTVALRRPFALTDYDENGPKVGSVLPVGTVLALTATDGALEAAIRVEATGLVGGVDDELCLLRAAAEVPCEWVVHDWCDCSDGMCSHGGWFGCRCHDDENVAACLGDKVKCPFEDTRAEAATSLQEQTQEKGGERS